METALLFASEIFMVFNYHTKQPCQVYILALLSFVCVIIQLFAAKPKLRLKNYARPDANFTVFYSCCLFPTILFVDDVSPLLFEFSLLVSLLSLFVFLVLSNVRLLQKVVSMVILLSTSFLFMGNCNLGTVPNLGNISIGVYNLLFVLLFFFVVFVHFVVCRNSFSTGECMLVAQLVTCLSCIGALYSAQDKQHPIAEITLSLAKISIVLVYSSMFLFSFFQTVVSRTVVFYSLSMCVVIFSCTAYTPWLIKRMLYFANFIISNSPQRLQLLAFWIVVSISCFLFVAIRSNQGKASTVERKVFHVFILLVYIPGILLDIPLLFVSSAFVCVFLAIASTMQAFKIEPFGFCIHRYFDRFRSSQDTGKIVLTPLYLLLGLSLPLWLSCAKHPSLLSGNMLIPPIAAYSGIISVGIGDAVASLVGSNFGTLTFPGRRKTVEGTLASILSQLLCVYGLSLSGSIDNTSNNVILAIIFGALTEAYTIEIDNLVVPLLTYFLFDIM